MQRNRTIKNILLMLGFVAIGVAMTGCSDDEINNENGGTVVTEVDADLSKLSELSIHSYKTSFNLTTDANARWTATVVSADDDTDELAYVYPKEGVGSATLNIVTLDNMSLAPRQGILKITFPDDATKNIDIPLTQEGMQSQAAGYENQNSASEGNLSRGIGYGYNAFDEYCRDGAFKVPVLKVDEMYDNGALVYRFRSVTIDQREESAASVEELAEKLNTSAHAGMKYGGFSASVDLAFNNGQKKTASNEFAWLDINVVSCNAQITESLQDVIDLYMTDKAYRDLNNEPRQTARGERANIYPSTPDGFRLLVKAYGTHVVMGGKLGGRLHTQAVCNTAKITTAYNASLALKAAYSGSFAGINVDANAKAQLAHAMSTNSSAFHLKASVRGGGMDDGSFAAMTSVIGKMNSALAGTGTEDDLVNEENITTNLADHSAEYEAAGDAWKKSLIVSGTSEEAKQKALSNIAILGFNDDSELVPLYEFVDRTLEGGQERYEQFKDWFENELMNDPEILAGRADLSSYITTPPTIIDPLPDLTKADCEESLIQDIYLDNGVMVARICSEYIPIINPSKRVNVIYPVINGKTRYNLGLFCGDEGSFPAQVSWGMYSDKSTPLVTNVKGYERGVRNVAYLRGNHLSLEPDNSIPDDQYLTTSEKPYVLSISEYDYPLVKINDYIYTRDLYRNNRYNDGTYHSNLSPFSDWYDTMTQCHYYRVYGYTTDRVAHGGFAPSGWFVPFRKQYSKMIDMLSGLTGNLPDKTIGNSFLKNGVYGLNTKASGFQVWGYMNSSFNQVFLVNKEVLYLAATANSDEGFWDDATASKSGSVSARDMDALAVTPEGGAGWIDFNTRTPTLMSCSPTWPYTTSDYTMNTPIAYITSRRNVQSLRDAEYYTAYPVIICRQAVK